MIKLRFLMNEIVEFEKVEGMEYLWCRDLVKSKADFDEYVVEGVSYEEYVEYCVKMDGEIEEWMDSCDAHIDDVDPMTGLAW